jgi:PKD repeat protein
MKLKLFLLLVFISFYSWSQSGSTKTYTNNGTFLVPAGVNSVIVQAWGGGGSGGGASGAPLLLGRGAAGGGGGAYASAPILVTPGATLNVVVASQTAGTSGTGAAGGKSTITGFESTILAAGGSGGDANNAGGSPAGGIGGTLAASAGSSKFAGVNGGNGNSWNLLGLLLSSGAGGAGAGSGGAGGGAVSGLILSNAPGIAGSPAGGGGSGAINSALGVAQIGGAGAAGKVIISYSCPNYSIISTTATSICASSGTTSSIIVTGSAASLPIGNYVVTYNRSSPSGTALTANLTVSTAGTGTFTAVGLTTAGSSTITITKLESDSCSSTITTNNTATVTVSTATVGGAVSGGTTINAGSTSGLLTLSGHTGGVIKWQSSVSPFSTWTDIANTTTTYTSGVLSETTQFRAVVQNGLCTAVNSVATTVTVNPRPTIELATSATSVCSSADAQSTTLSYSAVTANPTTYSIVWDVSPTNSFAAVTDATLPASPITITVPAGTNPGTYTGTLKVKNANGAVSNLGSVFTVTVNETPRVITTGAITSVCTSTNSQNASLTYSASTNNPTYYSIIWDSTELAPQGNTPFAFLSSGGIINNIVVSANAAAGTYSGRLFIGRDENCSPQTIPLSITILPATVGGAVSGGTTINAGSTSDLLTLSGHTGTVIKWQSSVSPFSAWTDIANTTTTYTSGVLTETTQFRAVVQSGLCAVVNSAATTVTVNPRPTIALFSSAGSLCLDNDGSSNNTRLGYTGTTENPITYSIVWDASPTNSFVAVTDAALPTSPISISVPGGTTPGTYSGTLTVKNANGAVSSPGSVFTVTIYENPTITTTGVILPVDASSNARNALLGYSFSTGNATSYSIDWDAAANTALLADQGSTAFVFGPNGGLINGIVIPANVPAGTYFGTMEIFNGHCSAKQSVSITVNALPTITLAASATSVCSSADAQSTTLSYSATTGNPISYSIVWDAFPTNSFVAVTDADLPASPITIAIPAGAVAGTYTGTLTVANANGSENTLGSVFTVTVSPLPTIVFGTPSSSVCGDGKEIDISKSYDVTGSPISYSIVWNSSPPNNFADITDATLSGGFLSFVVPAGAVAGTYTGVVTVKNADGCVSSGLLLPVTVDPPLSITTTGVVTSVCTSSSAQNATLVYSAAIANPRSYHIIWDEAANAALLENQFTTAFAFDANGGVLNTIVISANAQPGTYSGKMTIFNSFCFVYQPISITILPATVGGTVSGGTTICSGNTSELLTLSDHTGTVVNWQSSVSPFTTWSDIANTTTTYTSGVLTETTQFRAVVDGDCGVENSEFTTVTVNPTPTITFPESEINTCTFAGTGQLLQLAYSNTTGAPSTYSIVWDPLPANNLTPVTNRVLRPDIIEIFIPLIDAGTYTGTLTVKNADGCVSTGSVITIIVHPRPTISTTGTIDAVVTSTNFQNTTLAYSGVTENPTNYEIDWDDTANAALLEDQAETPFAFASGGGVINNIAVSANVPAGTYTGLMIFRTNYDCAGVQAVTITVNALPTITLSNPEIQVCLSPNPDIEQDESLDYSTTTGNPTTYSIVWDASPANSFVAVTDEALPASPIIITVPAGTNPGTYTGMLTVKDAEGNISLGTPISIIAEETISVNADAIVNPITTSNSAQNATLPYSGFTGNPVSYSIDWNSAANSALLVDQGITPFTFVTNGGVIDNIYVPANVPPGTYLGAMSFQGNNDCTIIRAITLTINPQVLPTIVLASNALDRCSTNDGSASGISLGYTETTGSPTTYSIVWDASPANSFVAITDAVLPANSIMIDIPAGTIPGTYTGTLTVKNALGSTSLGSIFTVTTKVTPLITTTGIINPVVTNVNSQTATLTYSGVTGNPVSYFIDWNFIANDASLADQPSTPFAFSPSGGIIDNIQVSANVPAGDYIGIMYIYNGICYQNQTVYLTVNPVAPTITLAAAAADICTDIYDSSTTLSYSETSGSPITYSIIWDASPANNFREVNDEDLLASPILIFVPARTNPGIYRGTLTVKDANDTVSLGYVFTVDVKDYPSITTSGTITPVTVSTSNQIAELVYSGVTENPVSYSIDWDDVANAVLLVDQGTSPFAFAVGGGIINSIEIPANVPAGTYTGTMIIYNETGCPTSQAVSITVNALPTITLSAAAADVCSDIDGYAYTTPLSYSATTGSPTTYSIVWNASPANNFASIVDQALPASPISILITGGTAAGTYTGTLTVKNANGTVSSESTFTVKVKQTASIISTDIITPVNSSASVQYASLAYSGIIGNPVGYNLIWDNPILESQGFGGYPIFSGGGVISNIAISANVPAGIYTGKMNFPNGGCFGSHYVSITIEDAPAPTIGLGAAKSVCNGTLSALLPYKGTTGDPITYSIVWDASPTNSFVTVTDASLPEGFITIDIPGGTANGIYTGTLTVKNALGTSSSGSTFEIRIGTTPTITTSGTISSVYSNASLQYTSLEYSGVTGSPIEYFIDWDTIANNALLLDQGVTPYEFAVGGGYIETIAIPANVPVGTYSGNMFIRDGASCERRRSVSITINAASAPTIELAGSTEDVCLVPASSAVNTTLNYAGTTGAPMTYSIIWNSSPTNYFTSVSDAVLPSSPITIVVPLFTVAGTYTGILTVKNIDGVSSSGTSFNVNVGGHPEISIDEPIQSVCTSANSQITTLAYSYAEGQPTSYYIDWDQAANDALLQDQNSTAFTVNENDSGIINGIEISANAQPGSYTGIMYYVDGICSESSPVSIVIKESPTAPIIGEIIGATTEVSTGSIAFSGLPSGLWYLILVKDSQEDFATAGDTESIVIDDFPPGDYAFRVINAATNCSSGYTGTVTVPASSAKDAPTKDIVKEESTGNTVSVSIDNKVINVNTFKQKINQVSVYDVSGNLLYNRDRVGDSKLSIDHLRSSNQVLLVRVVLDNNRVENKKVIY